MVVVVLVDQQHCVLRKILPCLTMYLEKETSPMTDRMFKIIEKSNENVRVNVSLLKSTIEYLSLHVCA